MANCAKKFCGSLYTPPNQFAQLTSWTPRVFLIASPWLVGIEKNSDVARWVTMRVDELASVAALKPSSTARSDANRNTAMATLITVSSVRRLLRRALFRTRPMYFMAPYLGQVGQVGRARQVGHGSGRPGGSRGPGRY